MRRRERRATERNCRGGVWRRACPGGGRGRRGRVGGVGGATKFEGGRDFSCGGRVGAQGASAKPARKPDVESLG